MEMSFPWLPSVSVDCVHSITASQRRISDSFTDNKQKKPSSLHWKQSIDEDQRLVDKSNTHNTTTAYLFSVCWVAEKSERCCCCCFSTYIECSWAHMHWTFLYIRLFTRHTYISSSTLVREKKERREKEKDTTVLTENERKKKLPSLFANRRKDLSASIHCERPSASGVTDIVTISEHPRTCGVGKCLSMFMPFSRCKENKEWMHVSKSRRDTSNDRQINDALYSLLYSSWLYTHYCVWRQRVQLSLEQWRRVLSTWVETVNALPVILYEIGE